MKKLSLYISIALAGLFMGSCSEDFKDWADPQTNPQEDAITIPGFTATAAQAIDFASVTTDSVNTFSLSSAALPEGFTLGNARIELTPQGVENATKTTVNTSLDGKGAVADLASVVESAYGKRPTARTFDAQVYVNAIKEGQAVLIDAGKINLVMTPKAPFIDAAYYLVGDMFTTEDGVNGWNSISDKQAFKHSDKDVYDDPVFTITFETTKANQYWKIIPKANVDAGNTDASAAGVVGPKVDGEDSMTGSLTNVDAKAGKIAKAGKYKLTLDMMDYTYTIEEVNYDPFIYFIGSTDGWKSSDQKLALVDEAKGVYTGYVYVADPNGAGLQFKFQRVAGSWDNEINAGAFVSFGGAATNENGNIGVNAGEGVYYFDVNLSEGTITATKIETMGMIGDFNKWAGDAPMTWNAEEYCFEATNVGVTADGWKFRVNGGWDINLGGSLNNLTAGGDNITVAGNTVKLYPTRKTNDNIYCTVE